MHCDFVTISIISLLIFGLVDPSQAQNSSWINLGTVFSDVFCSQHQCCSSFRRSCANPHSETAFSPDTFLCSLVFAFVWAEVTKFRFPGAAEEAVAWLAAQLVEHLLPYHRRWSQPHRGCSCRHMLVYWSPQWFQLLAFINELSELVNFILSEACQVNPPASVSLNDNSIFPLFPWLIISKKWHNLPRVFSLKSTDTVWGVSAWMEIFQSYKHMKTRFYDRTRILSNVTKALLQLRSLETTIHIGGSVLRVPCSATNNSICGSKLGNLLPWSTL